MSEMIPEELQDKFEELDRLVQDYFKSWWAQNGDEQAGDYIASWALVANFGNLEETSASGYIVETSPSNMSPHAMKGLFLEGVDWVVEQQERQGDED